MSAIFLANLTYARPLVSPRLGEDVQQPQIIPFIGLNPTDPRMVYGLDGLRPAAAAMAMMIADGQSDRQEDSGTILTPYVQPITTRVTPTPLFVSALTTHATTPLSTMPTFRTSDITPMRQSTSEPDALIVVCSIIGLLVVITIGKFIFGYLQESKRKLRLSQQSWGHKKEPFTPADLDVTAAAPATDAEGQSLRTFSFPSRPGGKATPPQEPSEVAPELTVDPRFSALISPTAFRQSYTDHDSITTRDTASTLPYLLRAPSNVQRDHLRSRSAPTITDDSVSTVKPARCSRSQWDIARSSRTSQTSTDMGIPNSFVPCRRSRLSIVENAW